MHPIAAAPTKVVFMGTPPLAAKILQALAADKVDGAPRYQVVAAFSQPDRPAGRGRKVVPTAVKAAATDLGIPVHQPTRLRDGTAEALLAALAPAVVVVAAYGRILPKALLEVARHGCINVHASLLPRWRGASPIARSILHGDAETGVSIMQMDEGCDTGGVFAVAKLTIDPAETTATLTERLADLGAHALVAALPQILNGSLVAKPQPTSGVSHAGLFCKADGALDFTQSAQALARQVRALTPWPSAYTSFAKTRVIVLGAHPAPQDDTHYGVRTGEVLEVGAEGLRVACGRGSLWLTSVKPAGSGQMHAARWIGGRGPKKGATLEEVTSAA